MLTSGTKFASVVIMIASAVLAFITLSGQDELASAGSSSVVQISKADDGASAGRVADSVESFARQHRVNIGRLYDDPLDVSRRSVFLAVGNASATSSRWINRTYSGFSPEVRLRFRSFREARTLNVDGAYLLYGSPQQAHELLRSFKALGYQGTSQPVTSLAMQITTPRNSGLRVFLVAVVLVIMVAVASSVLLNAKFYGIQRLHGCSPTALLVGDVRRIFPFAAMAGLVINLLLTAFLHQYNSFRQFDAFLRMELVYIGALSALALLVHALTVILLQGRPIAEAITGRVSAGWAFAGSYVLRGWSLLLVLSILSSGPIALWTLADARTTLRSWTAVGEAYYLRVSAAIEYAKNAAQIDARIGRALRAADERHEVSIAARHTLSESKHDLLLVNERYLDQHDVRDARGVRVRSTASARLLVPERYGAGASQIEEELPRWAAVALRGKRPQARAELIPDGQTLMFSSNAATDRTPLLRDPVVLVAPVASGVVADGEYTTMATNGGIVVQNPDRVLRILSDAGVGEYILGVTPFAHDAAQQYRQARRTAAIQSVNLIIGSGLLVFTAVAVAFVFCGRHAQALFARHLHGWGFVRAHWPILALETALGVVLLAWAWSESEAIVARSRVSFLPPYVLAAAIWKPVLVAGVLLIAVTLAIGAVRCLTPRKEIG